MKSLHFPQQTASPRAWTVQPFPDGGRSNKAWSRGPFFPHSQPSRRRLRLRQSLPVSSAPGLGALALGGLLRGDRRVTRRLVEVGDDPGQHPKHTGTVERHGFRLGIALGPQVHHDPLATVQAFEPLAAPAERFQLARQAGLEVRACMRGAGRLRPATGRSGRFRPPPLTQPAGDLAGLVPSRGAGGTRLELRPVAAATWRTDNPDLMGFDDGPDPLALGLFQAFRGEAEPGGELLVRAESAARNSS